MTDNVVPLFKDPTTGTYALPGDTPTAPTAAPVPVVGSLKRGTTLSVMLRTPALADWRGG